MAGKKKIMTAERRDEIDRAMEATGGVLTTTSTLLKCRVETLKKWIRSDDILMRKWKPNWIKEEDLDPEVHRPIQLSGDQRRDLAIAKENKSLAQGFRDLGFNEDEIKFYSSIASFTNGRMDQVIDFTYGGMARGAAKMLKLADDTKELLDKVSANPDAYNEYGEKGNITYSGWKKMKEIQSAYLAIQKEIRATNEEVIKSKIQCAKIEEIKKRQKEEANKTKKVPGFGGPPEVFGNTPNMTQNNYYCKNEKQADADI